MWQVEPSCSAWGIAGERVWAAGASLVVVLVSVLLVGCGAPETREERRVARMNEALRKELLRVPRRADRIADLIREGADPNTRVDRGGQPALWWVAASGNLDLARLLLDAGADVDGRTETGNTPLMSADTAEMAELLLERGADPNARNLGGATVVLRLLAIGRFESLRTVVQAGGDVDAPCNENGETPVFYAATDLIVAFGEFHVEPIRRRLRILAELGADLNARDRRGLTPLMKVIAKESEFPNPGTEVAVVELLRLGADPTVPDVQGRTAADLARAQLEKCNDLDDLDLREACLAQWARLVEILTDSYRNGESS